MIRYDISTYGLLRSGLERLRQFLNCRTAFLTQFLWSKLQAQFKTLIRMKTVN